MANRHQRIAIWLETEKLAADDLAVRHWKFQNSSSRSVGGTSAQEICTSIIHSSSRLSHLFS